MTFMTKHEMTTKDLLHSKWDLQSKWVRFTFEMTIKWDSKRDWKHEISNVRFKIRCTFDGNYKLMDILVWDQLDTRHDDTRHD